MVVSDSMPRMNNGRGGGGQEDMNGEQINPTLYGNLPLPNRNRGNSNGMGTNNMVGHGGMTVLYGGGRYGCRRGGRTRDLGPRGLQDPYSDDGMFDRG